MTRMTRMTWSLYKFVQCRRNRVSRSTNQSYCTWLSLVIECLKQSLARLFYRIGNPASIAPSLSRNTNTRPRRWNREWNRPSWDRRVGIELTQRDRELEDTKKNLSGAVKVLVKDGAPVTAQGASLVNRSNVPSGRLRGLLVAAMGTTDSEKFMSNRKN